MSVTRRDFVIGSASLAALCAVGGLSSANPGSTGLVRPVGATDETAFLAGCLRCDRCRSVCPTNCIDIAHLEDGILQMRTPKMNYHLGYCDFCNKCVQVCPTDVLHAIDPQNEKLGIAVVLSDQCVAWKNPGSCSKCKEVCTYDAIHIVEGVPVVDDAKCNGCGRCVNACPALVYTSTHDRSERGIEVRTVSDYERSRS